MLLSLSPCINPSYSEFDARCAKLSAVAPIAVGSYMTSWFLYTGFSKSVQVFGMGSDPPVWVTTPSRPTATE